LFIEYERQIVALEIELKGLKDELNRKNDLEKKLLDGNDKLVNDLEVKSRQYLELVEKTCNNIDLLNNGSNTEELTKELDL
jgi:hypothetical protein